LVALPRRRRAMRAAPMSPRFIEPQSSRFFFFFFLRCADVDTLFPFSLIEIIVSRFFNKFFFADLCYP